MFHKNVRSSARGVFQAESSSATQVPQQTSQHPGRPVLVSSGSSGIPSTHPPSSGVVDLVTIAAHRCGSFFAEAAVLVLVLALLDRLMAKGSIGPGWIFGAIALSLGLLIASVATDFTARRWLRAH